MLRVDFFKSLLLKNWWICAPFFGIVAFLPSLNLYFSGEDFTFIHFAYAGKLFYESSQNLFYRPLANLLWQFDYNLWGLNATGYHLTNVILHALNVFLVECLVFSISRNKLFSLLTASLFAILPIHTEPVVWVAGRPDLLATLFFLIALLTGLTAFRDNVWIYYLISIFSFAVSIFCKESSVGLPIILFLWVIILNKQTLPLKKVLFALKFLPYLLIIGFYLVIRINVLGGIGGYNQEGTGIFTGIWNLTLGLWIPLLFPVNFESAGLFLAIGIVVIFLILFIWLCFGLTIKALNSIKRNIFLALVLTYATILPAVVVAPVAKNLEQSRLLYLPSIGFCLILSSFILLKREITWRNYKPINPFKPFQIFLPGLISLYLISLIIAFLPWISAGNLVVKTLDLLQGARLPVQAGDTIYYQGLPDNFQGAYVWRNGLDEATKLVIGPKVEGINRTDKVLIDYRKAITSQMWFVQYNTDQPTASLKYLFSYSVGNPLNSPVQNSQNWTFTQCDRNDWVWKFSGNKISCEPSQGLLFDTSGQEADLVLQSPFFMLDVNTNKVVISLDTYVYYDFQQPLVSGELILNDVNGHYSYQQPFQLAADGKNHYYQFAITTLDKLSNSLQVTLKINKTRSSILWKNIILARQ